MKMSVRRIVLLILSILVLGFGLYDIISVFVQTPELREEILSMFSDPQISAVISDPERIVDVVIGIATFFACIGGVFYLVTGLLGILAAVGKYRGGAHIVLTWIYLVFCAIGLITSIVGFITMQQFDWSVLLSIFEIGVAIAVIIVSKQIKEGNE